jgi:hypothetical protein
LPPISFVIFGWWIWQAVTRMVVMIGVYFGGLVYFALKGEQKE